MPTIGQPEFIPRTETERVRISLEKFRGRYGIDIRIYFMTQEGDWRPTKRGVRIPIEFKADLLDAIKAVAEQEIPEEEEEEEVE